MTGAGGVAAARFATQRTSGGAIPTPALQSLQVMSIPVSMAKPMLVARHYLHSWPAGTQLAFGVFQAGQLHGALALGAGPANAHRLVRGAAREDCLCLTRLWLTDALPTNAESRVISFVVRALRKTSLKFIVTYADPAAGHSGTIYQAANFQYAGLSQATPLYDAGDGVLRHSRSFSHIFGTRDRKHFSDSGISLKVVTPLPKYRYVYFLDPAWRGRLLVPTLPYPKKEVSDAHG